MPEPTGDLRERLADALRKAAYVCPGDECPHDEDTCGVGEPIVLAAATYIDGEPEGTLIDGEVTAIADAVLPVVEAALAEQAAEFDEDIITPERALHEQTIERAERAEAALRDLTDPRACDPHPGNGYCQTHGETPPCPHAAAKKILDRTAELLGENDEQRRRAVDALAAVQRVRDLHNGGSSENTVLCVACCNILPCPTIAALDQPEETPDA